MRKPVILLLAVCLLPALAVGGCAPSPTSGSATGIEVLSTSNRELGGAAAADAAAPPATPSAQEPAASSTAVPPTTSASADPGALISEAKAKSIALNHAKLADADAKQLHIDLERDSGRDIYDIDFYNGNKEYSYNIDAATGEILEFDYDTETSMAPAAIPAVAVSTTPTVIAESRAIAIALQHAGIHESNARMIHMELDHDSGRPLYEGGFYSGDKEYEYDIDAVTGNILSYDHDYED
ncbi:MAG: PepSY domain-containing protein [Actinomycetia bacterium]|nr:PepSY domain-containing protein [Actinomycetes bacterium]